MGLWDTGANNAIKILDKEYKIGELPQMLEKWNLTDTALSMLKHA